MSTGEGAPGAKRTSRPFSANIMGDAIADRLQQELLRREAEKKAQAEAAAKEAPSSKDAAANAPPLGTPSKAPPAKK